MSFACEKIAHDRNDSANKWYVVFWVSAHLLSRHFVAVHTAQIMEVIPATEGV